MIAAFVVAIIAVLLAFMCRREKQHSYLLLLSFVILTLFLSLGYYWGNDVVTYEKWFDSFENSGVSWWNFTQYDSFIQTEIGYICINLLCKPLGFWGMRALLFTIENAIIYAFIIRHVERRWYWLAVFIYVFNPNYWVLSSSMMRQWLAICVVMLSVEFLIRNKYIIFTLFVVLAFLFHLSAIICLILLPLSMFQKNATKKTIISFFIFLFFYYLLSPSFINYIGLYLQSEELYMGYTDTHGSFGISSVLIMFIYTIVLYYAVKTKQHDSLFSWIVMLYGLVLPLLSFGELSARLSYYFAIFTIGSFPLFIGNSEIRIQYRVWITAIVCMLYLYNFILFFQSPTWVDSYGTYQTIIGKL